MAKGKGKNSGLSEFRKDTLELMVEFLARKFGVNLMTVMPASIKDQLIRLLGGPDGEITEKQIYYFSMIPKFLFSGTLSEEAGQSFVKSFGESLRAYGQNPNMDRDARRTDIQRFLNEAIVASEAKRPTSIINKANLFERIANLPSSDSAYMVRMLISLQAGSTQAQYEQFYDAAKKLVVEEQHLFLVIQYLKNGKQDMAYKELVRVLKDAALVNPPEKPKSPNFVDFYLSKVKEMFENLSGSRGREIIDYVVQAGDTTESIATAHKITETTVCSFNHLKRGELLTVGKTLRVVQGPFSDPFRQIELYTDNRRRKLGK